MRKLAGVKNRKAFVCMTSLELDLPMGAKKIDVYSSLADLKLDRECWQQCGVYEIEIKAVRVAVKPKRGEK